MAGGLMSNENQERLVAALSQFDNLNLPAALKTNLGEVSISGVVEPRISTTIERCRKAGDFVNDVNRLQIIPLADATVLLVAIDMGFMAQEGLDVLGVFS